MKVKPTHSTKYLEEVISSDGKNSENISQRRKIGFGTIKDISKILDNMCLDPLTFQNAVVLRDSMLVGTLPTCSEAWYNLTELDLVQLEQIDKSLWSNLLEVARTVPYDLVCLELGKILFLPKCAVSALLGLFGGVLISRSTLHPFKAGLSATLISKSMPQYINHMNFYSSLQPG